MIVSTACVAFWRPTPDASATALMMSFLITWWRSLRVLGYLEEVHAAHDFCGHTALLARALVNFRPMVATTAPVDTLDWREGPDDDLVLALAIAAWEAERRPG